jgi:peptidoglycan/LPS O-acetylase OafA/YrhL
MQFSLASGLAAPRAAGSAPASVAPSSRLVQLDGLRFFAFFAVFLHHAFDASLLWAGVDLFFVLSGYLITGILLKARGDAGYFRKFYFRRFLRLFPAYYLFLLVVFGFFAAEYRNSWPLFALYLSNFNTAFHWMEVPRALNPMWSLAVEEQFYLLWPVLVAILGRRGIAWLSVGLVIAAPLIRLWFSLAYADSWPSYSLLPSRMDLLAAGALLVIAQTSAPARFAKWSRWGPALSVAALASLVGMAMAFPDFRGLSNSPLFNTVGYDLLLLVMVGVVGYLVEPRRNLLFRVLSYRPLVYLGTISYGLYLWHGLVLIQVESLELGPVVSAVLGLLATISVASISWWLLERPIQGLRDGRLAERFLRGKLVAAPLLPVAGVGAPPPSQ